MPEPGSTADVRERGLDRRSFLARTSALALLGFAAVAGAPGAASARPKPPPCRLGCAPVSKTGCACGGHLFLCSGCGSRFHACVDGQAFRGFCLRRDCR